MIGFLIKKNFFDTWDNIFKIALLNLGFIASFTITVFIPSFIPLQLLEMIALFAGFLWCFIYLAAAALSLKNISDYGSFGFSDFFANFKSAWSTGLVMGAMSFFAYALVTLVIPFYLAFESMLALMLAALLFWAFLTAVLALQFFFAVRFRLETSIRGAIKKCFIFFFDNPMFCIFSLIHSLFALLLTIPLAFLVPGPAGILLFLDEGLRLRLLKYAWLEANPEANRRKILWDSLLAEEKEKTGTRSLKNFIFPWKD